MSAPLASNTILDPILDEIVAGRVDPTAVEIGAAFAELQQLRALRRASPASQEVTDEMEEAAWVAFENADDDRMRAALLAALNAKPAESRDEVIEAPCMWAEVKADDLTGELAWECNEADNRDGTPTMNGVVELGAHTFAVGTKLKIYEPSLNAKQPEVK